MFGKFSNAVEKLHGFINIYFLPDDMKSSFHDLIKERVGRIYNI